ncbi:hypothetical protein ABNZ43_07665 [Weissella sp. GP1]|uniref:Sigma-70 family RNA polymerase sigma factor n=1 Tax=Weissella fermenti TaxID=2987699 RepID=A0ABT6D0K6_9LACO|nr:MULTISPECIES: hypothetical protein [Weissella]MBJ7687643.1 hypothetical protein [Weissella confusa]MDF9298986.1 hypothetical protein [Weissella sp. BK2]
MMVKRVPDDIEDIMKDARNGDAIALTTISSQFNGLIWREYARQDSRINPSDWYSEAQYVLYRALASLRLFTWPTLVTYYEKALRHHAQQIWRLEYRVDASFETVAMEDEKRANGGRLEENTVIYYEEKQHIKTSLQAVLSKLTPKERQFLKLWISGYKVEECAEMLHRSKSWGYLMRRNIQIKLSVELHDD